MKKRLHQINLTVDDKLIKKHFKNLNLINFSNYRLNKKALSHRLHFVLDLLQEKSASLNIRFCADEEMCEANQYYRNKAYVTDVLSFSASSVMKSHNEKFEELGDILISVPQCYRQAKKARQTLAEELEKMIVHGIIHLKGFDHERSKAAHSVMIGLEKMVRKELVNSLQHPDWFIFES